MKELDIYIIIDFTCELLDIDNPKVHIGKSKKLKNTYAKYYTSHDLYINPNNINDNDLRFAIFHELRHHYQTLEIEDRYYESEYTVNTWKSDLYNYKDNTHDKEYTTQSVEIDANAFATIMMKALYNLNFAPKDKSKHNMEKVQENIYKIIHDFPLIEIRQRYINYLGTIN